MAIEPVRGCFKKKRPSGLTALRVPFRVPDVTQRHCAFCGSRTLNYVEDDTDFAAASNIYSRPNRILFVMLYT